MKSLDDKICNAINIIAKRIVDKAKYDKVVKGQIMIEAVGDKSKYRVKVGQTLYEASPIDNKKYKNGDTVYLLIPQNDSKNTKFILGKEGSYLFDNETGKEIDDDIYALRKYYQNERIQLNGMNAPDAFLGDYSASIGRNSYTLCDNSIVTGRNNKIGQEGENSSIIGGENNINYGLNNIILNSTNAQIDADSEYSAVISSSGEFFVKNASNSLIIGANGADIGIEGGDSNIIFGGHINKITNSNETGILCTQAMSEINDSQTSIIMNSNSSSINNATTSMIINSSTSSISDSYSVSIIGGFNNIAQQHCGNLQIMGYNNVVSGASGNILGEGNVVSGGNRNIVIGHLCNVLSGSGMNVVIGDSLDINSGEVGENYIIGYQATIDGSLNVGLGSSMKINGNYNSVLGSVNLQGNSNVIINNGGNHGGHYIESSSSIILETYSPIVGSPVANSFLCGFAGFRVNSSNSEAASNNIAFGNTGQLIGNTNLYMGNCGSHVFGNENVFIGNNSRSEYDKANIFGRALFSYNNEHTVLGTYNEDKDPNDTNNYAFTLGMGTTMLDENDFEVEVRKNAFSIIRPGTGETYGLMEASNLNAIFNEIVANDDINCEGALEVENSITGQDNLIIEKDIFTSSLENYSPKLEKIILKGEFDNTINYSTDNTHLTSLEITNIEENQNVEITKDFENLLPTSANINILDNNKIIKVYTSCCIYFTTTTENTLDENNEPLELTHYTLNIDIPNINLYTEIDGGSSFIIDVKGYDDLTNGQS